jgi:hypothetical protein
MGSLLIRGLRSSSRLTNRPLLADSVEEVGGEIKLVTVDDLLARRFKWSESPLRESWCRDQLRQFAEVLSGCREQELVTRACGAA